MASADMIVKVTLDTTDIVAALRKMAEAIGDAANSIEQTGESLASSPEYQGAAAAVEASDG